MKEVNKPEEKKESQTEIRRYMSLSNEEINGLLSDYRRLLKIEKDDFSKTITVKILELEKELIIRSQSSKNS